eukprot:scaffold100_cov271-Pinguiococcus_pyrenoidosus.AAC.4
MAFCRAQKRFDGPMMWSAPVEGLLKMGITQSVLRSRSYVIGGRSREALGEAVYGASGGVKAVSAESCRLYKTHHSKHNNREERSYLQYSAAQTVPQRRF